jgi:hypothetical protein
MKSAKKMQQIVTQLAQKHGLDLTHPSTHLRLAMDHMDPLVIEKINHHLLSVAHYYIRKDIYLADPEVIFYTGNAEWVPFAITQMIGGLRIYATVSPDGELSEAVDLKLQADLAGFANWWANNLTNQAWLEHGQEVRVVTPNTARRFPLGRLLVTSGAKKALEQAQQESAEFFSRHQAGDYGAIHPEDVNCNVDSLKTLGGLIMSAYRLNTGTKIWLITDADWGRTTILLPEEY